MELGQSFCLGFDFLRGWRVEGPERLGPYVTLLESPRAGDLTVDEERVERMRVARVEHPCPVLLPEHGCPAGVGQQDGVPHGKEAHRSGRVGIRAGRPRKVEQLLAVL